MVFQELPPETKGLKTKEVEYPISDGTMQPARLYLAPSKEPRPLLVAVHAWSADYKQCFTPLVEDWCVANDYHIISPNFHGPSWNYDSCGSGRAIQDVLEAIDAVKAQAAVDTSKIFLYGCSGGGHFSMQLAARHPEIWAGVVSWVGISDLAKWHAQTACRTDNPGFINYSHHLEKVCGGKPGDSPAVDAEYTRRSPITWLRGVPFPLEINAGIHDGHTGSVPVSQTLEAFNKCAGGKDRLTEEEIEIITKEERIPDHLKQEWDAPEYATNPLLFRRRSGNVTVNIFEGGHQVVPNAMVHFMETHR